MYWKAKSDECEAKIKEFKKITINDEKIRNMNDRRQFKKKKVF